MTRHDVVVDVAVVGAGPAGIAAAALAAENGKRVLVLDENPNVGGQIWRHRRGHGVEVPASRWLARLERSGASRWQGAAVVDACSSSKGKGFDLAVESSSPARTVRASSIVLATGARERFLPFPGWTLPGVIGVGGAQAMLKSGVSFDKSRVIISGSGPLLLPVASSLSANGANVLVVAEQARTVAVLKFAGSLWSRPATLVQAARYRSGFIRAPYRRGWWVTAAHGSDRVEEVELTNGLRRQTIACDVLCASFGLVANTEIARLLGCDMLQGAVLVDARQQTSVTGVYCAGECTGIGGVELSLLEGEIAGRSTSSGMVSQRLTSRCATARALADRMLAAFALRDELRHLATPETITCRCEDVRFGAIDPAWGMRKAKLYTRAGMGPCQGRICGSALEFIHGWAPDRIQLPSEAARVSTFLADDVQSNSLHDHGA